MLQVKIFECIMYLRIKISKKEAGYGNKIMEDYFLDLAKTCASRSNCIRAQVGAVIVGEDKNRYTYRLLMEHLQKLNLAMKEANVTG